jgi:hypothetical protein
MREVEYSFHCRTVIQTSWAVKNKMPALYVNLKKPMHATVEFEHVQASNFCCHTSSDEKFSKLLLFRHLQEAWLPVSVNVDLHQQKLTKCGQLYCVMTTWL